MTENTGPFVEYLATAGLGEKGQITVPKEYRDAMALEAGAPISVLKLGAGLVLIPEQLRFRGLCDRIAKTFAGHGVTATDLLTTLPEARERVFARHYPEADNAEPGKRKTDRT